MSRHIFAVSTDNRFASSLKYVRACVLPFEKNKTVTTRISHTNGRHELAIEFSGFLEGTLTEKDRIDIRKVRTAVANALADIIITDCKSHFICTGTNLPVQSDLCKHAFIKALSEFDSRADKFIAKSLLRLSPTFLLDSFFDFMLSPLKKRWQEVINLANENVCYLVCGKTFDELLRFLISNIESRSEEVHLFNRIEKVEILNSTLKPFKNIYINEDLPKDIKAVSELITIAPKKIFLHQENTPFEHVLVSNIQNMFGSCVMVINN